MRQLTDVGVGAGDSGAFGGGDIKLMAACGVFLGWRLTLVSTVLAILGGGIYGIWLMAAKKAARKENLLLVRFYAWEW